MTAGAPVLARTAAASLSWLSAIAAQAAPAAPAAPAVIEALLARLDGAFARGDAAGYLGPFEPDHPDAHAALAQQLARTFAHTASRTRSSHLVGAPRALGAFTVVRVRNDVELVGGAGSLQPRTSFAEHWLLALRARADGAWAPMLAVETQAANAAAPGDRVRCPACNYEIGGAAGWLCAPLRVDRAAAIESASFYLLGSDVTCDVSVQVDPDARDPAVVVQQLADELRAVEPGCRRAAPGTWLPPAYTTDVPRGLRGAELAVDVPAAAGERTNQVRLHVVAFGGLQHVLVLRGSAHDVRAHETQVQELFATYRLLERDRDLARAAAEPLTHHTGGSFEGGQYRNDGCDVELTGAPGWRPAMLAGGVAFRVVWTSPRQSRVWLTGYRVPCGMSRWCQGTAMRWLQEQCDGRAIELRCDDAQSTPWSERAACGDSFRTLVGSARANAGAGAPPRRWFRVLLRDDLLVVADGLPADEQDDAAVQKMLQSLRRP